MNRVYDIIKALVAAGGTCYFVGGTVRDQLMHRPSKDLDIEVHELTPEQVKSVLSRFGTVLEVGAFFGVVRIAGFDIDWSLPRADGVGRKPSVSIDPFIGIVQALRRRDVTMNAMAINATTGELIDPFGGAEDIRNKILRATDVEKFVEDPLRFYRVMRFCARFGMDPDATLTRMCSQMDIMNISRERIEKEFELMFEQSALPARGIRWIASCGRLREVLPELSATCGVVQDVRWHPEGDVFEHTMQALDAVGEYARDERERSMLCWAAICHDLGKAVTTRVSGDTVTSYNHEIEGVPLARALLRRITHNHDLVDQVCTLVRYHMMPGALAAQKASAAAYKRLARHLAPQVTCEQLGFLAYADRRGRNPQGGVPLAELDPFITEFLGYAERYGVLQHPESPVLTGKDFLDVVAPGPALGKVVKTAYEIQIAHNIRDHDELKKRALDSLSADEKSQKH